MMDKNASTFSVPNVAR